MEVLYRYTLLICGFARIVRLYMIYEIASIHTNGHIREYEFQRRALNPIVRFISQ